MPTPLHYMRQEVSMELGCLDWVHWLNGVTNNNIAADAVGPGYTVVEAFDGSTLSTPSGGTTVDHLPGGHGWRTDVKNVSTGGWIVLESLDANNTNHFQVYIEFQGTLAMNFLLIPLADFATGGGAVSPPTFPATAVGAGSGLVTLSSVNGVEFICVADEGMFALMTNIGGATDSDWIYVGEIDLPRVGGSTVDDRCYVIWDNTAEWMDSNSSGFRNFNRLSPFDDTTILTDGGVLQLKHADSDGSENDTIANDAIATIEPDNGLGEEPVYPLYVGFKDTSHYHVAGLLRNVYEGGSWLATRGTINTQAFLQSKAFLAGDQTSLVFDWDGVTAFP